MQSPLATSAYARVLVIDTQVVLETRPLDQLPWSEMGEGPILLLVCRQVQSEIDAKKSDGRLGERSRAFNRLLDHFLETRTPSTLREEGPRVDVALMRHRSVDWAALDDLDGDDGDDRIVAQALNALVDDGSRLELLSHDMRPRDAAASHGMKAVKLPEHWLREKAQTPEQREVSRLRAELRTATADQPALKVELEAQNLPWSRTAIDAPSDEEIASVRDRKLADNPRPASPAMPMGLDLMMDDTLPERHQAWRRRLVDRDLPAMHLGLSRLMSQVRVRVILHNVGVLSAEALSLEIRSGNCTLHADPYLVRAFGDPAPQPESHIARISRLTRGAMRPLRRDEPFAVYRETDGPGDVLNWSCRSFRQERVLTIDISVELEERTSGKAQIEAVVTAANLKGDVRTRLIVDVEQQRSAFADAYDVTAGRLGRPPGYFPQKTEEDDAITIFRNDGSIVD